MALLPGHGVGGENGRDHPFGWFENVFAHYRVVRVSGRHTEFYGRPVTTPDAEEIGELIQDCAAIPAQLRPATNVVPLPRSAAAWTVNEACLAQVDGLDEY